MFVGPFSARQHERLLICMPGIYGILLGDSGEGVRLNFEAMARAMPREVFDRCGSVHEPRTGVWLGWSAHVGSFADANPVWNETREILLVFAGEAFPDGSEIDFLRTNGHALCKEDASYLIHAYEEQGMAFLDRVNGWFSGVLVDLREERAFLFNDRYGFNRIYWYRNGSQFYFSSSAACLLAALPELRSLDEVSLGEYLACGCVLQNRSLFSRIGLLPPGSLWCFSVQRGSRCGSWFEPSRWEQLPSLSEKEYCSALVETFRTILPKYFRGNQPIGMSLTGGLDGRMIMAHANRPPGSLPCYTFGSRYRENTDVTTARRIAAVFGQPHHVITLGDDFLEQFPALAEKAISVSDGAMDVTGAAELYVNQAARQIATVRMTGNYGSEILRGNIAFGPRLVGQDLFVPEVVELQKSAFATYAAEAQCHPLTFIAFKQVPWHHYSRLSVELSQLILRAPYLDNALVELVYQAPRHLAVSREPAFKVIADGCPKLNRIPTDRGLVYPPTGVLMFLHNVWREFTFRAEYAFDYGMPQWLASLNRLAGPMRFENLFLGQHKFHHFRVWYRDELASHVKNILLDRRTLGRPYVNASALENIVLSHTAGRRNYTREIHKVMSLELLHRQFLD